MGVIKEISADFQPFSWHLKPGRLNKETSGHVAAVFLEKEPSVLKEISADFPAVFLK